MKILLKAIEKRLTNIESILLELKNSKKTTILSSPEQDFKFMPIQDIFNKKICSKPTFYKYLKAGDYKLYKFHNKSFVDIEEFLQAFKTAKNNK